MGKQRKRDVAKHRAEKKRQRDLDRKAKEKDRKRAWHEGRNAWKAEHTRKVMEARAALLAKATVQQVIAEHSQYVEPKK